MYLDLIYYIILIALEESTSFFNGIFYLHVKFSNAAGNFLFSFLLNYISSPQVYIFIFIYYLFRLYLL